MEREFWLCAAACGEARLGIRSNWMSIEQFFTIKLSIRAMVAILCRCSNVMRELADESSRSSQKRRHNNQRSRVKLRLTWRKSRDTGCRAGCHHSCASAEKARSASQVRENRMHGVVPIPKSPRRAEEVLVCGGPACVFFDGFAEGSARRRVQLGGESVREVFAGWRTGFDVVLCCHRRGAVVELGRAVSLRLRRKGIGRVFAPKP